MAWCVPTSAGQGREVSLIGGDVVSGGAGLPGLQGVACPSHGLGGRVAGSSSQEENCGEEESPDWPQ